MPQSDVTAAGSSQLLTFAAALAESEVPAGFILASGARAGIEPRKKQMASEIPDRLLPDAAITFEAAHPGYRVRERADVLAVEPRAQTVCRAAVSQRIRPLSVNGSLPRALNAVL